MNFLREFNDKYYPRHLKEKKEEEFLSLKQDRINVAQYETKFMKLSKFTPLLVATRKIMLNDFLKGCIGKFMEISSKTIES